MNSEQIKKEIKKLKAELAKARGDEVYMLEVGLDDLEQELKLALEQEKKSKKTRQ